ncbi:hypothetical protein GF377_00310 [candidate division GN15 bacterium]|nr:hypothetical protein [candidate division GN15 bacterium]
MRVFQRLAVSLIVLVGIVFAGATISFAFVYDMPTQGGGDSAPGVMEDKGWPGGDLFPNHDPNYTIINLTNNDYQDGGTPATFPNGYYLTYPGFNANGMKIAVAARSTVGPDRNPYEVWIMDYDPVTQTISNYQQVTTTAGTGDVYWNNQVSWSRTDPDLLMYLEVHDTSPNIIKTYDVGTDTHSTLYDPALDSNGDDVTNPGFYGNYNDRVVFGSSYGSGNDRILVFDGTYPSTTISPADQNLDPASNYDGTRVTYYSTQATYANASVFSDFIGGVWNFQANGFGDPTVNDRPGYWAYYSGEASNMILSLAPLAGWSANQGLGLFHADGTMITDIIGDGSTSYQWAYANHNWQGPNNEILFRAEELSHTGYGNNMFIAVGQPTEVWVDDDWDGPTNAGGKAWGFDAFSSIQDAIYGVAPGGTVYVANGTYIESNIDVDRAVLIDGESEAGVVVAPAGEDDNIAGNFDGVYQHGFLVAADDVTIQNLTIDGEANPALTPGKNNFRIGILNPASTSWSNTNIFDVTLQHLYYRGIYLSMSAVGATVDDCTIEDIEAPSFYVYGVLILGDAVITDNELTDVGGPSGGRAIGTAYGDITVTGNVITNGFTALYNYNAGQVGHVVTFAGNTATGVATGANLVGMTEPTTIGGPNPGDANEFDLSTAKSAGSHELKLVARIDEEQTDFVGPAEPFAPFPEKAGDPGIGLLVWYTNYSAVLEGNIITCSDGDAGAWLFHCEDSLNPVIVRNNVMTATASDGTVVGEGVGIFATDDGTLFGDENGWTYTVLESNDISGFAKGIWLHRNAASPATGRNVHAATTRNVIDGCGIGAWTDGGSYTTFEENIVRNCTSDGILVSTNLIAGTVNTCTSNHFSGNAGLNLNNQTGVDIVAEGNWWGVVDPVAVAATVSNEVKYSPWVGSTGADYDGATDGWQYDLSVVGVSLNGTIQEGVDLAWVGGTVNVAAGTYVEQVDVGKDLTIVGEGIDITTVESPATLTAFFNTGSNDNYPVVYAHDGDVHLEDMTIDGAGQGNANYRFVGIGYWNAGGSATDVRVTSVRDEPFSGSQHGVSVYSYNDTGGPYTIDMTNVSIDDMQKNGFALLGDGLTANLDNCTVVGQGATTVTAQNGIQIGSGAGGTIVDCSVSDIVWAGATWTASGLLLANGTSVDISGTCTLSNVQTSVFYQDMSGTVTDLVATAGGHANEYGALVYDVGGVKAEQPDLPVIVQPFDADLSAGGFSKAVVTNVAFDNVTLTGAGTTESYGILVYGAGDDVTVSLDNSVVDHWDYGAFVYEAGSVTTMTAFHTSFTNNTYGAASIAAATQDFEYNYWGSINYDDIVPLIDGDIDFDPWCNSDFTFCDFTANPDTVWVNDDWAGSSPGDEVETLKFFDYNAFDNIADALTAVAADGWIEIYGGSYPTGLLVFDKNLTVSGDEVDLPQITATETTGSASPGSWFEVNTGATVDFEYLSMDGTGYEIKYAIGYWDGGGSIVGCEFSNIKLSTYLGVAVLHYSDTDFLIENCQFSDIGRIGVFMFDYPTRTRIVRGNTYTGKGVVDGLDYAFEVGGGAAAEITNNVVTNNTAVASSDGSVSGAVLATDFYGTGTNMTATGNVLENNSYGFLIGYDSTDATVASCIANKMEGNDGGLSNAGSALVEATACWWGDVGGPSPITKGIALGSGQPMNVTGEVAPAIATKDGSEGLVHYSPWVASNGNDADGGTDGWQPNLIEVGVSTNGTIQEGVDLVLPGGTVNVTAGTYEEQVNIAKDLYLLGEGQGVTIVQSPTALTDFFTTGSNDNYPIMYVHDADVDLEGLTVDGLGRGNANYRFVGIGYYNAGGSITDIHLTSVRDEPFSGSQHGVSVYANIDDGGPYSVDVTDVLVDDMQKTGISLAGDGLTCSVTNSTVVGQGPTDVTAQNGIQIGFGADGTVTDCSISDIAWTGGSWIASGMLFYDGGTIDVLGNNVITNTQANVVYQETDGTVDGLTVTTAGVDAEEGISIRDYGAEKLAVSDLAFRDVAVLDRELASPVARAIATTVAIENVTLTGVQYAGSYGIASWSLGDDVNVTVTNSEVTGWEYGAVAYEDVSVVTMSADHVDFSNNLWGVFTNAATTQDFEQNYWGVLSCPDVTALMDGDVDFDPWCNSDFSQCNFSCSLVEVWVDDDYCDACANDGHTWGYDAFDIIPDGVDAVADGGTVHVLAGEYDLPVNIEDRTGLLIDGANALTVNFKPATTLGWEVASYGSSRQAAIRVVNSTGVTLRNMTMDFDLVKGDNVAGLLFWNSAGAFTDNTIKNMSTSGYYELTSYLRAPDADDANRLQIDVLRNTFNKTGRLGVVAHDYVHCVIEDNTFDQIDDDFGYGCEIGSMASAVVRGNTFRNYDTWAATDQSSSAAIYVENAFTTGVTTPLTKAVTIEENEIEACQIGIHVGNEFAGFTGPVGIDVSIRKNSIHDCNTTGSESSGGIYIFDEGADVGSSVTAVVDSNQIINNGDFGIAINSADNGDITAAITGNRIMQNYTGLSVKNSAKEQKASTYDLTVHHNVFNNFLNAEDDVVGGFWDDAIAEGNCWHDFDTSNAGYPTQYVVAGNGGAIDRYPLQCFGCCTGPSVGNVDGSPDDAVTLGDLTVMIDHLFITLAPLACPDEGNTDRSLDGKVSLGDLTVLIDHLFITLDPLPPCPRK